MGIPTRIWDDPAPEMQGKASGEEEKHVMPIAIFDDAKQNGGFQKDSNNLGTNMDGRLSARRTIEK